MGEIGIPRREFLYDIRFWEARRIVRGYRKRDRLTHQMLAEVAYAVTYMMRNPEGKRPKDLFPSLFDDENDIPTDPLTEADRADLQALIDAENAHLKLTDP